ncbi:MAG: glycosyltransferase family 1 protein [Nanoarchaeota archaeon]
MKIGIVADGPKISGSMKYILQLYSRIRKKEKTSLLHLAYEGRLDLKGLDVEELKPIKLPFFSYFFNFGIYYPIKTCFKSLSNSFDIIHFSRHYPFFILWHKILTKKKIVITSHDLWKLNHRYLLFLTKILKRVDKIITVSNATKKELVDLGLNEENIEVIYHGVDKTIFKPIGRDKAFNLLTKTKLHDKVKILKNASKIFLSVSNDTERKNTSRVYEAFSKYLKKDDKALLVRVVSATNKKIIESQTKRFSSNVLFLQGLSEEEISLMYNISDLFVFPSICEGFGMPLLESISCGTPCVTSNFQPMTEVVGESGILVDPYDVDSIYQGLILCLKNRDVLSKKSLKRAELFSLDKTFLKTYEVYKDLQQATK